MLYRDVAGPIEVFDDPDRSIRVGRARCIGWDAAGSAVWRLVIDEEEMEGPWVIVDREFLSTRPDWRELYRSDFHPESEGRRGRASHGHGHPRGGRPRAPRPAAPGAPSAIA